MLAYKTFVEDGETLAEGLPARAAREISSWGADLTGSNCTVGPQRMVEITGQMADEAGPVAAFPNPGLPQLVGRPHPLLQRHGPLRPVRREARRSRRAARRRLLRHHPGPRQARSPRRSRISGAGSVTARRGYRRRRGRSDQRLSSRARLGFAERLRTGFAVTVEVDLPRGNDHHAGSSRRRGG